ncbi:sigma-B regulation protein RsbU (phosphoserine phosphatase) [Monaibacterium marinum]|uniref:Sigma-B regulation protein RsbU (Phosphoserine phosphatase) n=1 Tax=Pontivivens marinum TaxID=1690039 RepID=A0A2C9CWL4_9RHOB|nr:SpoIIE family protein phosphatase [Monaibacterium marinum]SOH94839.1 sigma-B regulation protein RsbU (phosphoserine phosphatase) [Monaibacterium marinum]
MQLNGKAISVLIMSDSRLKIIVAEDNPVQRKYLALVIEKLGFEVLQASDGLSALKLVQETGTQIVISDYQMPGMDGIELTQRIRDLNLDYYVYIIMNTGSEVDGVRSQALDAGVDDFLTKGRSPVLLQARLRAATRLIHHASELAERTRILKESNERIEADLRAAATAQRQLLPNIHETILGFRVASAFAPSSFVSGDMFGCIPLSPTKLGFYAVDVSGHGVHASLLSVAIGHLITPEFFQTKVLADPDKPDPAALVDDLNQRFCAFDSDEYFTMFCGVIDTTSGEFYFCQAGYPSPYYVEASGKAHEVGDGGFPVGMLSVASYENNVMTFEPGASLVVLSDAASEAENAAEVAFGTDRLRDLAATIADIGAEALPDKIINALAQWRGGRPLEDDLTIVALERTISDDTHNLV